MKNRWLAFFGACFVVSLSIAPFQFNQIDAEAANTIVELTPAQTLALFGSSIDAEYNLNLNEYDDCTFQYVGYVNNVFDSSNITDTDFLTSYTVANSYTYLVYACFDTAYTTSVQYTDFQFELTPSVSITDLSFFRTSVLYGITSSSNNNSGSPVAYPSALTLDLGSERVSFPCLTAAAPYTTFRGWIRSAAGDFPLPDGVSSTQYVFGAISCTQRDSVDFAISGLTIDLFGMIKFTSTDSVFDNCYFVLIQCPLLSDGYNTGGGSGGGSEESSGNVTGQLNSDGSIELTIPDYTSQLDEIISKLDQIAADQGYDDLVSDGLSSSVDNLDSEFDDYADAEEDLWSDIDGNLDALDSMDFAPAEIFENSAVFEAAEGFSSFLGFGLLPIFIPTAMSMIVVSYIIFGKSR